jgi:hypothetical protein
MNSNSNRFCCNFAFLLISASVLLLELAQARLFSIMFWHHLSYMVITIALLGFGCAGTLVCIGWKYFSRHVEKLMVLSSSLFSLLTLLSFALITQLPLGTLKINLLNLFTIFLYYFLFFLPYLTAGFAVSLFLSAAVKQVNNLYCINMIGSGAGCLLMIILIGPLGGETTVMMSALLSSAAAMLFAVKQSKRIKASVAALTLIMLILTAIAPKILPVRPAPYKALSVYFENKEQFPEFKVEYSKWNPISRIDVVSAKQTLGSTHVLPLHEKNKNLLIDGHA